VGSSECDRLFVNVVVEMDVDVVRRCTSGLIQIELMKKLVEVEFNV